MSESAPLTPSLLDRLLDTDATGAGTRTRTDEDALAAAVRRDLAALLNANRPWRSVPDRHATLRKSLLGFGLPDFSAGAFNLAAQREILRREIAAAIRQYEPRLAAVSVTLRDRADSFGPDLRLRVDGFIHTPAADIPLSLPVTLDTTSGEVTVGETGDVW